MKNVNDKKFTLKMYLYITFKKNDFHIFGVLGLFSREVLYDTTMKYFTYGNTEIEYLSNKDAKMKEIIDEVGIVYRKVDNDLFSSVIHHIIGQQISTKAQETIWNRMVELLGVVNCDSILASTKEELQSIGLTFRKVEYIQDFSKKVKDKEIDLDELWNRDDEEVIQQLITIKGIGRWTAEMILLFCMQRKNVFSYDDLAIQRGLRMLYHHRKITKKLFEKYRRRFSPYCSIASIYLWEASKMNLKDPGVKK